MVDRGLALVYGGGKVGLMGEVANSVLERGGRAFGVIPRALVQQEIAHPALTELLVVETMHEREALLEGSAARLSPSTEFRVDLHQRRDNKARDRGDQHPGEEAPIT